MDIKQKLYSFLNEKGFKKTKERDAILLLISEVKGHFDAEKLYLQAIKSKVSASRASVYRTVMLFKQAGIINETFRKDGKAVYELTTEKGHHDHLICMKCGKIEEFNDYVIEEHQEKICEKYGFTIKEHRLEIKGICRVCK